MSLTAWVLAGAVIWLVGAVFSFGMTFAFFQREYPHAPDVRGDLIVSLVNAFTFPLSLPTVLIISKFGKHGLNFSPWELEEILDEKETS